MDEKKKNIIKHDKLDAFEYNDVYEQSNSLQRTVEEGQERLSTVDSLSEDVFYSLYKNSPRKRDSNAIQDAYKVNEDLVEKVMRTKQYEKLRTSSKLDKMASALGARTFTKNLLSEFSDEELEEMDEQSQKAKERQQEMEKLEQRIEALEDANQTDKAEDLEQKLQQLQQEHQDNVEQLQEQIDKNSPRTREAIRKSLEKAKEATDSVEGMMSGWGMGASEKQQVPWEEKMELAEKLQNNTKLQEIADMIGKMKRLALSVQKQKTNKVPEETQSIEQGNDLSRVLPSELIHLDEETEVLFLKKFINRELLQYKLEGNEPEGKGPIIACIDTSGSMKGQKEIWAKGVAMGLYNIAKRQDRDFHVILFSRDLDVFSITRDDTNEERREKTMKMLETMMGGGTDFNKPLSKAMQMIDEVDDRSDIVFITDGEAKASDEVLEQIESKEELFIAGIGISDEAGGLEPFSDAVYMIENIVREGRRTAEDLFDLV